MIYYIDLIKFVDRPLYPVCGGKWKPKMQSHITEKKIIHQVASNGEKLTGMQETSSATQQ